jgi:hypothetical protein
MALKFDDIKGFEMATAALKADVKLMGKKIAQKDEMAFLAVSNYPFKDGKTGIMLIINKESECKKAYMAAIKAGKTAKKGAPEEAFIAKNLLWGYAKYVTDEATGTTAIEFEKKAGKGKPSLMQKQLDKNPWIKAQEFECRFTGSDEEVEDAEENGEVAPEAVATTETANTGAPQIANLAGYWKRIQVAYAELQKTKSKEVALKIKDDGLKFQKSFGLASTAEKAQYQKVSDQIGQIFKLLGVSSGAAATAADSPERKAAKDANKISKQKLDALLKAIDLDSLYKMATA